MTIRPALWSIAQATLLVASFPLVKVGEDVYAFIPPENNGALMSGNSVVVMGEDNVLVVDSGHAPSTTAHKISQIKAVDSAALRARFVGDNPERALVFDQGYVRAAVIRAYREAKEGLLHDDD